MPRVPSSVYFESLAKVFGMQLPHLWTGCYPRSYEINSAYAPPFYASVDLALLQGLMSRGSDYILEQQLGEEVIAAQKVARSSVPTYFICPELFTVARKPQNQLKFDWTRMRLTHEAASFVFPREGLSEPDGDAFKFAW